jgi:hypothetical protein
MPTKRKAISEALARSSGSTRTTPEKQPIEQKETESQTTEGKERGPHYRPGRENKRNVTGYFPPEVKHQLRLLCAEQDTTIQEMLAEALNDLFAKYGKAEIAPVNRR